MLKKLLLTFIIAAILFPFEIYPQYFVENFNYPEAELLQVSSWGSLAPLGVNYMRVTSPGLTYNRYLCSGIGNALHLDTTGPDEVFRNFHYPGVSSGSMYTSMIVRVFSASTQGGSFMTFSSPFSIFQDYDQIHVKASGSGIVFGISKSGEAPVFTTTQYSKNIRYLLVLKHTFDTSGSDLLSLYVFGGTLPSVEPAVPTLGPINTGNDPQGLGTIKISKAFDPLLGLHLDGIYIDNIWKIGVVYRNLDLRYRLEAMYPNTGLMKVYLASTVAPFNLIDSVWVWPKVSENTFRAIEAFLVVPGSSHYLVTKHRNSIETWSANPVIFNADTIAYDFTTSASKAYGNNMSLVQTSPDRYAFYTGDINQDGAVDQTDLTLAYNDVIEFKTGNLLNSDLNGDEYVDMTDLNYVYNNSVRFVGVIRP